MEEDGIGGSEQGKQEEGLGGEGGGRILPGCKTNR